MPVAVQTPAVATTAEAIKENSATQSYRQQTSIFGRYDNEAWLIDQSLKGDFRDKLFSEGYAVVKGAFSKEKASEYVSRAHDWLESWELGYKRDDPSTWDRDFLPSSSKGGLYNRYGVGHEQLPWDVRMEPGIIEAFAKIWGTDELLVSFDASNFSVPLNQSDAKNANIFKPWAHVDQAPHRTWLHCIQGIANFAPNGPLDGGLRVLKGSKALYEQVFEKFAHQKPEDGWPITDSYHHTPEMLAWLEEQGCEWEKVCAEPGDLILWDSRTVHYGAAPVSRNPRMACYVCYKPAAMISEKQLASKVRCFDELLTCTHDPISFAIIPAEEPRAGDKAWAKRHVPEKAPVLSQRGLQLAGVVPY